MLRIGVLTAIVLATAACGGSTSSEPATSVVTHTVVETVTATPPVETISTVTPSLSSRTFQMPSRNIGCMLYGRVLACDVLSGLTPEPKRSCELDWAGMILEASGRPQPRCAGDTVYDQDAPVLEYGKSWARNGFTCASMTNGVQCRNGEDHGFLLSRETWTRY
ncbi:MAG TPA: DUF6636 domain-containing protein [Gaiellaceae bacterium]|nr:DUF6636 domain-containing protein [Gaiellaceae bacterium]